MERSAASLKAGGNTMNEALGLITAANLIPQNAENTANALKVLSLRIRNSKTALQAMGEEVDDLSTSTSKLRKEIKGLTGVDIMKDNSTYKSTAQIIKEIGAVYSTLDDVSQANVTEILAGKTRASVLSGLLENYQVIDEVIKDAENAEGSAERENQKAMDSISGRIKLLTSQFQEFWKVVLEDDGVKKFISLLTKLSGVLTKFEKSKFGGLGSTLGAIAGITMTAKNIGRVKYNLVYPHKMPMVA